MATIAENSVQENGNGFDLCRISKAKKAVDVSDTTIRKLQKEGRLRCYKCGKNTFFSKSELALLIRGSSLPQC